ncbi:hypothetical protein SB6422_05832 [Klebsiella huaxiensis]|uniref:Uncharacterized protein n=1 Tax=Klebsiella huaxiensis TaxID=2153354 RepID=A0A564LPK0_9ENTR|nr:hypothetical protein SB6422_05832 [Klebsiella huaxiensis]
MLTTKPAGATPISTSMTRPMPFWPSFAPCENDTPMADRIRAIRVQNGGFFLPSFFSRSAGVR